MIRIKHLVTPGVFSLALLACASESPTPARTTNQVLPSSGAETVSHTGAERVVSSWNREAAQADVEAVQDTLQLLQNARTAIADPRGADRAIEMLERAEARILTRDMPEGTQRTPMNEGPQGRIAAARRALAAGNRPGALQALDDAMIQLRRG